MKFNLDNNFKDEFYLKSEKLIQDVVIFILINLKLLKQ